MNILAVVLCLCTTVTQEHVECKPRMTSSNTCGGVYYDPADLLEQIYPWEDVCCDDIEYLQISFTATLDGEFDVFWGNAHGDGAFVAGPVAIYIPVPRTSRGCGDLMLDGTLVLSFNGGLTCIEGFRLECTEVICSVH